MPDSKINIDVDINTDSLKQIPQLNSLLLYLKAKMLLTKISLGELNKGLSSTDYSKAIEQVNTFKLNIGLARKGDKPIICKSKSSFYIYQLN